jgi:hypothetical protein
MRKNMEIGFHSGIIFQFQNVPSHIHANLMVTSSAGAFFIGKIKNRYTSIRIDKHGIRKELLVSPH